jgi:tetratricopeptide (TPR) repeat protein
MLTTDPGAAATFADAWYATGGGDGAAHCLALARIGQGQPDVGAEMLQKLAATSHAPDLARALVYGQATQAWLIAGQPAQALGSATMALVLSPDDPDLLIDRSVAAGAMSRFQDAIDDLTRALDLDPHRPEIFVYRGSAWRHLGQAGLAQDDIDRALAMEPDNAEALLERGILKQRRNDREGARTDWERAILLAPDTATADLAQQNIALLDAGPEQR